MGLKKSEPSTDPDTCCYWVDGNTSTYRKWYAGKPSAADNLCIGMTKWNGGEYIDFECNQPYLYICKVEGRYHAVEINPPIQSNQIPSLLR